MGYNGIIGLIIRETELASDCVNTWMNLTEGKPNLCGKFYRKAGTNEEDEYFEQFLPLIGIPDWNIIENF